VAELKGNGRTRFLGVKALAQEIGRSGAAVTRALQRGKTVEEIREAARKTDERRLAGKARGKQAGGPLVGPKSVGGYVPARAKALPNAKIAQISSKKSENPITRVNLDEIGVEIGGGVRQIAGPEPSRTLTGANPNETMAEAERRKMIALADERELTVMQKRKELLPVKEINAWFNKQFSLARNILIRMPSELRDRLAAETDPTKCEELVEVEVRRALQQLKEMPIE